MGERSYYPGTTIYTSFNSRSTNRIIGFSPPASEITDPNDPTFLAGQSLAQALCDQVKRACFETTCLRIASSFIALVSPCEYGLVLGKDSKGYLAFGPLGALYG